MSTAEPGSSNTAHPAARAALVDVVRDERRRVLATLVRITGNWQLSEDAVQDAVLRALEIWPTTGVPAQPRAWLTLTARNRAIDLLRREAARTGKEALAVSSFGADFLDPNAAEEPSQVTRDDELRLIFTCCHPSLAVETQIALALRVLDLGRDGLGGHSLLVRRPAHGARHPGGAAQPCGRGRRDARPRRRLARARCHRGIGQLPTVACGTSRAARAHRTE